MHASRIDPRIAPLAVSYALMLSLGCAPATSLPDASPDAAAVDAPEDAPSAVPACMASAPIGVEVGDALPDLTVYDCEGAPHTLSELCGTDVVWLWDYAAWCPPCRTFATRDYDNVYDAQHARFGERLAAMAIITRDQNYALPTVETCRAIRDHDGITSPLYFDPTGRFRDIAGERTSLHLLMSRDLTILWTMQYGGEWVARRITERFAELDGDAGMSIDAGLAVEP